MSWNEEIAALPGASILQTEQWGEIKQSIGWKSEQIAFPGGAMLVLEKPLAAGLCFLYVPRGPLMDWNDDARRGEVLERLRELGKERHAVFVKIDPEVPYAFGEPADETPHAAGVKLLADYQARGWLESPQQIQFKNTVWIDVTPDEETLLANMKQRTRYKVRLAEKKGVSVHLGTPDDFEMLADMYAETSARDGFFIRPRDYYLDVWRRFYADGMLFPLIAEAEGEACAAVMIFIVGDTARYVYGMSRAVHREKMPNYLLQWEAIRLAKAHGCKTYDLWGAPDEFNEDDRMWGVYQFKRGLGGQTVRTPGAYDLPLRPLLYQLFVRLLPRAIAALRGLRTARGDTHTA